MPATSQRARIAVFVMATIAELPVILYVTRMLLPDAGLLPAAAFFAVAVYVNWLLSGGIGR
jgi:hypothetical protein